MKGLYGCIFFIFLASTVYGQTITSAQNGPWDQSSTWAGGIIPTSANSTSIVIQHNVNVPNAFSVTVDQVYVDIFATLTVDAGGTATVIDDGTGASDLDVYNDGFDYGFLSVSGTLVGSNSSTITGTDGSNATFNSGGVYRHLYTTTEGSIPNAFWDINSTVQIEGYTANITASAGMTGNWGQNFGNFIFNCTSLVNGIVQLQGQLTNVQNDLTISATGTNGSFRFAAAQNPTVSIGRDLLISGTSRVLFGTGTGTIVNIGRDFLFSSTNSTGTNFASTGNTTISVARNFTMNAAGGRLNFASSGSAILNVTLDFTLTAGTLFFGSAGSATGTLNVTGNFTNGGTLDEGSLSVNAGAVNFVGAVTHTFTNTGSINNFINFSVASLSTLDLGTSSITGSGTFTLNGSVRLGSTDAAGALQTGSTAGNIRVTGLRTYATGSTIIYDGAGAQFIGDGFPPSGVVNLTIDNPGGVTLSTSLDIVALSVLTLTSGNIVIGTQTLTINGTVSGAGGIIGGPSSNLVIGGTGNFGTLTFNGTNQLFDFTLNRGSSGLVILGGDLTILGTFTHTLGELAVGANTLTISGNYGPGTPDALGVTSASTVIINGTGTLPTDIAFTGTELGTLTINRGSATIPTTSTITLTNLNLLSGTFSNGTGIAMAQDGTITRGGTAAGSMTTNPSNTTDAYNVVYTSGTLSTGPELPTNTTALADLSKTGTGVLTLGSNITVNGTLSLTNGSFNAGTNSIDLKGNFVSSAASTLTSSPFTFSGTTTISGTATPTFGVVTISASGTLTPSSSFQVNGNLANNGVLNAGSGTTIFGGTTTISGSSTSSFNNLTINTSSTLTAPAGNFNVAGTWTNNGTFNAGASTNTVTFNGTSSIAGSSATNFSGITVSGTLNAPATLNVAGYFTNNGIFNRGTGTVVFNGSSIQNIQGTAVTDFNNINVTNTGGTPAVRVQSNANLRGVLTLVASSSFDADGSANTSVFTLISTGDNPTADAGIATLPTGASVTGNVTVQRYMAIEGTGSRMYRFIASPVQTPAVSQIQTEIPVTGSFTGSSTCSGCTTNQSMFQYNESVITGDLNTGYVDFPDAANTETLATARGYAIYVRGDVDPVLSATTARWDVRAPINSGTVSFPATFTSSGTLANDGWNLVGNPYPSTIDWDAASGWTRTGINNAIYMRDNGAGVVASYVGGVPANGGSRYIGIGQGFFVKSDGGPIAFQTAESVKVASQQTTFFREKTVSDILRITLRQGSTRDELVIRFSEDATPEFDGDLDAHKLKNDIFNLSSLTTGGLKLVINALPKITCGTTVNLNISDVAQGAYQLEFSEFESFSNDVQISVYDAFTDTRLDTRTVTSYAFEVTADSSSFGAGRISVSFFYNNPVEALADFPLEVCKGGEALINIQNSETYVTYSIYRDGVAITEAVYGNGGSLQIPLDGSLLSSGDNEFLLRYSPEGCQSMVSSKQIKIKSLDLPDLTTTDGSSCGNGNVSLTASGGEEGNYRWYETETDSVSITGASSGTYTTPVLNKSKTYYVSAINALGCEGARKPVVAVIHQYNEVTISLEAGQNMLTSSYETGNQWYFNGEAIPGATAKTVEANQTGLYEVEVKIDGCNSRAGREMIILGLENDPGKGYGFFPNPVQDKLTIELNKTDVATQGTVFTSSGQPLGVIEFKAESQKLKGEYNFAEHAAGMYLIRILQGNKIINYKVIKK
ncbi:MAG: T9SS type A sorting domain-containing protein [Cyclobacteriaceae bacterium]